MHNSNEWVWSIFLIAGIPKNPLFFAIVKTYEEFWKNNSKQIDYFMTDIIIMGLYLHSQDLRSTFYFVPNNNTDVFYLSKHLNADSKEVLRIDPDTYAQKLTYKIHNEKIKQNTWLSLVCGGSL